MVQKQEKFQKAVPYCIIAYAANVTWFYKLSSSNMDIQWWLDWIMMITLKRALFRNIHYDFAHEKSLIDHFPHGQKIKKIQIGTSVVFARELNWTKNTHISSILASFTNGTSRPFWTLKRSHTIDIVVYKPLNKKGFDNALHSYI